MIELENLYKTYITKKNKVEALKDVSIKINDSDIYGIIGYSGAGKSTLIRNVNLLEFPDSGKITINGITIFDKQNDLKIKNKSLNIIRKDIGMIFQHFNLFDRLTVFDNVAFGLNTIDSYESSLKFKFNSNIEELNAEVEKEKANRINKTNSYYSKLINDVNLKLKSLSVEDKEYKKILKDKTKLEKDRLNDLKNDKKLKLSSNQIKERVNELLELVGLTDKAYAYPSKLSGGQKQRVAIARALANRPSILLSDEATSALDPDATESILNLLKDLNKKLGLTIIVITHEMTVIKKICNRVSVMENGAVVESGSVYDVFASPKEQITKKFVGLDYSLDQLNLIKPNDARIIKLAFHSSVDNELLNKISKQTNVKFDIKIANVEMIQNTSLGVLIVFANGDKKSIDLAINEFTKNKVRTEVLE